MMAKTKHGWFQFKWSEHEGGQQTLGVTVSWVMCINAKLIQVMRGVGAECKTVQQVTTSERLK